MIEALNLENTHTGLLNASLGEILMRESSVSKAQLDEALSHQRLTQGKMGTHLVELGFLSLPKLEHSLSKHFGVPVAEDQQLERLDEYCRLQFDRSAVEKFEIIPFKQDERAIYVAMTNPRNFHALNKIAEIAEKDLKVFCISEIRYHYFLYRLFKLEKNQRIRNLYFQYLKERCRKKIDRRKKPRESNLFEPKFAPSVDFSFQPLDEHEELSTDEVHQELIFAQDNRLTYFGEMWQKEQEKNRLEKEEKSEDQVQNKAFEPEFADWSMIK